MSPRRRAVMGVGAVAAASVPQDAQGASTDAPRPADAPAGAYIEPGLYALPGGRFLLRVTERQPAAGRVWGECVGRAPLDVPARWLRPV